MLSLKCTHLPYYPAPTFGALLGCMFAFFSFNDHSVRIIVSAVFLCLTLALFSRQLFSVLFRKWFLEDGLIFFFKSSYFWLFYCNTKGVLRFAKLYWKIKIMNYERYLHFLRTSHYFERMCFLIYCVMVCFYCLDLCRLISQK